MNFEVNNSTVMILSLADSTISFFGHFRMFIFSSFLSKQSNLNGRDAYPEVLDLKTFDRKLAEAKLCT